MDAAHPIMDAEALNPEIHDIPPPPDIPRFIFGPFILFLDLLSYR